jgi:uncharacterized protein
LITEETGRKDVVFLRNSRFAHLLTRENVFCLLNSLTLRKVFGGQLLGDLFETCKDRVTLSQIVDRLASSYPDGSIEEVVADLREKGLIVSDRNRDLDTYLKLFHHGLNQFQIQHMYFVPTTACNFRCKYCFVEDEDRKLVPMQMNEETARLGLEVFAKLTEKAEKISLTFYGGEPLMNARVVYYAMHYVRQLETKGLFKRPVDMTLLTNGSLVDAKTVQSVTETRTSVSISIDGPEALHDSARKDLAGVGTYSKAISAYRRFQDSGIVPGVSCTLTKYNIDHIEEIARFIANELRPPGMGFNVLLPLISSGNPEDTSPEFAANQLLVAFKILREKGLYEDRVMRRVRPYIEGGFQFKDCMGVGGQLVLTPEGMLGPCQAFLGFSQYFPLNVYSLHARLPLIQSTDVYKNPLFEEWRHRFPLNMSQCTDCFAISICGGGCPYAAQVNKGSIWQLDDRTCAQAKQTMEWMIWDTYENLSALETSDGERG